AFARYRYRDDLYPTVTFRKAYDALLARQPGRADREYVRLLHLATEAGEAAGEAAPGGRLGPGAWPGGQAVRTRLGQATPLAVAAEVAVPPADLRQYDALLEGHATGDVDSGMSLMSRATEVGDDSGMSIINRDTEVGDGDGRDGGV